MSNQFETKPPSSKVALQWLGVLILMVASIMQMSTGFIAFQMQDDARFMSYVLVLILGAGMFLGAFLNIFKNVLNIKSISIGAYAFYALAVTIILMFVLPPGSRGELTLQRGNGIGLAGVLITLWSLRPNFGPQANKRIYQAYAGIFAFVIAVFLFILGLYIQREPQGLYDFGLDIGQFAASGTFPGNFYFSYIERLGPANEGALVYETMRNAGVTIMIGAGIIILSSIIRNKIGLVAASFVLFVGIVVCAVGLGTFRTSWLQLDDLFLQYRRSDYYTQLQLRDPGIYNIGMVLLVLQGVALLIMIYAATSARNLGKWRAKRDARIAAAEVAIQEGRLKDAIKYLETAAQWSSEKLDEEDRAIEFETRIKQIQDKAIKMRKAEAARKKKEELAKQKKKDRKKKLKESSVKAQARDEVKGTKKID